ncbi:MAG: methyltransferase domain-containing protein [Deltaproteobacteria bacterium]|nr:methyltransferase domain-containing protein [Deltaproteobacteria bacterium]
MSSSLASRWTIFDRAIQRLRFRRVSRLIPQNCILADCGCGSGEFLKYIRNRTTKAFGIDFVVKGTADKIIYLKADLNKRIPLPDESVDVVTALAVLEHLDNPLNFISEIFRILKKQGICVLTTPAPFSKPLLEFLAYKLKIISVNDIQDHKHYFSREDLLALSREFTSINIRYFLFNLNTLVVLSK